MLPKGNFFVLGIPMNSKSATYSVFQAERLYQPNDDGNMASAHQFPKPYVAISIDNSYFAGLAASTLQQCTGRSRIKLCRKGFSTTTDETILCLTSLHFNRDALTLRIARFLCLSSRSPTGNIFGKWRLPPQFPQFHSRFQERQQNIWIQFLDHRLPRMCSSTQV